MSIKTEIANIVAKCREIFTEEVEKNGLKRGSIEIRIYDGKYANYKVTKYGT